MNNLYMNTLYGSLAAGWDFWATHAEKVQHVGASGDFVFKLISLCQLIMPKNGFAWLNKIW